MIFDQAQWNFHLTKQNLYKTQKTEYKKQKKAFANIIIFIYEPISTQNIIFIQHVTSVHPYDMLRCFKNGIAPTDTKKNCNSKFVMKNLEKPGNQNIETWINE